MARINIYLSDEELNEINLFCLSFGFNRSRFFVRGAVELEAKLEAKIEPRALDLCKHGSMRGVCKYGCK
jgi:hypothetical protein